MVRLPGTPKPLPPERITKLDAARRHLATAIMLWFTGGDTVSIYTLSHAAYEVIQYCLCISRQIVTTSGVLRVACGCDGNA